MTNLILGAGLAGLSTSYHVGHQECLLLEKSSHAYGHIHSEMRNGFTWDEGPHVSFTKHAYVRDLFAKSVHNELDSYGVRTRNYFKGHWIDHPAQSNLFQVPSPLREECVESFLNSRNQYGSDLPGDYQQWLEQAFGRVFANTFPAVYTRKYWTTDPRNLGVDWLGGRMFYPSVDDVVAGSTAPLPRATHYITEVRYPLRGGYQSFAQLLADGAQVEFGRKVTQIDLQAQKVWTADGSEYTFQRLINTLPLPVFVELCAQSTPAMKQAAAALSCSRLLLVNVTAPHPTAVDGNWFYVYDEDKYSTRINCTERLTPGNAPAGHTGVQVEVYFSKYRQQEESTETIAAKVVKELMEMGFINTALLPNGTRDVAWHTVETSWANVIFDHQRTSALETIWSGLEPYGLMRESDDLDAMTDWSASSPSTTGSLAMAGRFGQWKYFWTDDCVLRGKQLGSNTNGIGPCK